MQSLNSKQWTHDENLFLLNNAHNFTIAELMEKFNATRSQIEWRCGQLKVTPKINKYNTIDDEQKEICLKYHPVEAAKRLGISVNRARKIRSRLIGKSLSVKTPAQINDYRPVKSLNLGELKPESMPVPKQKEKPITQEPPLDMRSEKQKQEEEMKIKVAKAKKAEIARILATFPNLLPGQVQVMKDICDYSPKAAARYCEIIKYFADNGVAWLPTRGEAK